MVVAALACVLAAAFLLYRVLRRQPSAAEIERARRAALNKSGKLGDGEVIDVEGVSVIYSYHVAGVGYTASQDVSSLEALLPSDPMSMIGPTGVKFDRRNPANSIVVCEDWNGLGNRRKQ